MDGAEQYKRTKEKRISYKVTKTIFFDYRVNVHPPFFLSFLVLEKIELELTPSLMRHGDHRVLFST